MTLKRFLSGALLLLSIPAVAMFLFTLLGHWSLLFELAGNFRLYILVVLSFFFLCGLAFPWKRWSWVLLVCCVWASFGTVTPFLPSWRQPAPGPQVYRLLSFNILVTNNEVQEVIELVEETEPDIILFLEYANHWHPGLRKLDDQYPHSVKQPRWHGFGMALFSKHPISDEKVHQLVANRTDCPMIKAELDLKGQPLNFSGVHTISPTNHKRLKMRNEQLQEVTELLGQTKSYTMIAGDFNCTPWSRSLSRLLHRTCLRDSRQGFGYQGSWPEESAPFCIPIDHVFVSAGIRIHSRKILRACGSDHFPVLVDFSLSQ